MTCALSGSFPDKEALEPHFFARQAADQQEIFLLLVGLQWELQLSLLLPS